MPMRKNKKNPVAPAKLPDHLAVLPLPLKKRIDKLIAVEDILYPVESESPDPILIDSKPAELTVNIDARPEPRPLPNAKRNCLDEYCSQTRSDRVKWDTKLYSRSKKFHHQTLYEQIEDLVDVAANEFAEWINTLGSDEKNRLNRDTIKQLFAIDIEDDVSKSISIGMKRRPAISRELAEMFDCPELSIERCVERILVADRRALRQKTKPTGQMAITNFPEEIRSGKILFEGIEHLRPTKLLVQHLNENRRIPRPKFLSDIGAFDVTQKHEK